MNWFNSFKSYVTTDSNSKPRAIHDSSIFVKTSDGRYQLKDGLVLGRDYVQVSKESWDTLVKYFGLIQLF